MLQKFILTLVMLITVGPLWAQTLVFDKPDGRHFVETYSYDGQWVVDEFVVRPGMLQELVSHKSFMHERDAQEYESRIKLGSYTQKSLLKLVHTEDKSQGLWVATSQWDENWELKYSQWIEKTFNADFFIKHNLATDCADVAYSLRWIFARIHKLPMGATLAGTGVVFTHESVKAEWNSLPQHLDWNKDQRFLKALNWLLNNVYTRTLYEDAYPLKISPETVRTGTINLLGMHTEVINKINHDSFGIPISVLSSTMPRAVRRLMERVYTDSSPINKDVGGLLQFRWLQKSGNFWVLVQKEKMPWYSQEQYEQNLCQGVTHFSKCVMEKLGLPFIPKNIIQGQIQSIVSAVASRVDTVNQGYEKCKQMDCSPGTPGWEEWNTPSRDKRLLGMFDEGSKLVETLNQLDPEVRKIWTSSLSETFITNVRENYSLLALKKNLKNKVTSIDPRDSIAARWASSAEGIDESARSLFARLLPERNKAIAASQFCRNNKEKCLPGSQAFTNANTINVDHDLKSMLAGVGAYCEKENCVSKAFLQSQSRFFFSSASPWHSLNSREGLTKEEPFILYGTYSLVEIGQWLIINKEKILHPQTKSSLKTPANASLYGLEKQKRILAVTNKKILAWNGEQFLELSDNPLSSRDINVMEFGKDHFILSSLWNPASQAQTDSYLFSSGGKLLKRMKSIIQAEDGSTALIHYNQNFTEARLLTNENGKIKESSLPSKFTPSNFLGLSSKGWIFSRRDMSTPSMTTFHSFLDGKLQELTRFNGFNSSRIMGKRLFISEYDKVHFYNFETLELEATYTGYGSYFHQSHDLYVLQASFEHSSSLLVVNNASISEFTILSSLYGVHPLWMSLRKNDQTTYVDHAGHELPLRSFETRSQCQTFATCSTNDSTYALNNWWFQITPELSYSVGDFGKYGNLELNGDPIAQRTTFYDPTNYWGSSSEEKFFRVNKGTFFEVQDGVHLYWP